jgi:hypothetical protein
MYDTAAFSVLVLIVPITSSALADVHLNGGWILEDELKHLPSSNDCRFEYHNLLRFVGFDNGAR